MSTVIKLIPEQPTLASIFNDDSIRHEPTLFSPAELDALERGLFYKKDKPYLVCAATGKERPAKPEEIVRQLWLRRLMEKYGYHRNRIGVEHGVHFGREVKRADVVVFDADRPDSVYVIGEFKKARLKDGKDFFLICSSQGRKSHDIPSP